jgi:DNA modification methylase
MASKRPKHKLVAATPVPALLIAPEQWPAGALQWVNLSWLKPHPRNARTHSAAQIEQLVASIAEHGFAKVSIVADEDGVILAGHGNVLALKRFGAQITKVPVTIVRGWTDEQKRAFMLRDNKIAENAGWDRELLEAELGALQASLPDLKRLGFSQSELDRLLEEAVREGLTDGETAPEPEMTPISRQGDLWLLGDHRLLCGDSTKPDHVSALLGGEHPQLMVTDPPYGVDYDPEWRNHASGSIGDAADRATGQVVNDHRADWSDAWALFPGDVAYVWHGALHSSTVLASLVAHRFAPRAQIIWAKERLVVGRGDYHWQHEPCWYVVRDGTRSYWAGDRSQTTLWSIDHRKSDTGHGTQKPIECMRRPIENNSRQGDAVYEPFSGSGTTIIAAEMTGRRALAIEIAPAYVDVAVRRWEQFTGLLASLANSGAQGWAAIATERRASGTPSLETI